VGPVGAQRAMLRRQRRWRRRHRCGSPASSSSRAGLARGDGAQRAKRRSRSRWRRRRWRHRCGVLASSSVGARLAKGDGAQWTSGRSRSRRRRRRRHRCGALASSSIGAGLAKEDGAQRAGGRSSRRRRRRTAAKPLPAAPPEPRWLRGSARSGAVGWPSGACHQGVESGSDPNAAAVGGVVSFHSRRWPALRWHIG